MLEIIFGKIGYIFSKIIVKFNGGIWNVKSKLNVEKHGLIKRMLLVAYEIEIEKKGSWIGYNSYFAGVPILPHGMLGIFISGDSYIGENCVLFQQVTIGSNTLIDSKKKGSPHIGDNCYIAVSYTHLTLPTIY